MMRRWSAVTERLWINHSSFTETLTEPGPWTLLNPVEQVSPRDAVEILRRWTLRLPTEAEWEYAARAVDARQSRSRPTRAAETLRRCRNRGPA
ncbi:MAG: SUMF1/EgtB/PvdO family nonheme iron enzyme [Planctomycetes bacterium]|nr:SUMF1/EgtB/PvdO family nonheme iron enzyme [Planctomycetota bacterium]